jgi:hypothetical protein
MDNLLLNFFLPSFEASVHSVLQVTFATLFIVAVVSVARAVARTADAAHWERNLAALDQDGGGTSAYGSADELGNAVATRAERWADVLPSLLLVFGLLGTFIGLGLALTEAAGALGKDADALANLTPIMNSLGSKFKTSTWGILAFLGLKTWFMLRPYDERRHAWATARLRDMTARAATQQRQQHDAERLALIDAIARVGDKIGAGQEGAAALAAKHHADLLPLLQRQADLQKLHMEKQLEQDSLQLHALRTIGAQGEAAVARDTALLARLETLSDHGADTVRRLAEVADHVAASRTAMEDFSHNVRDNIQQMAKAAGDMALAAQAAGQASTQLGGAVGEFRDAMTAVLGEVKADLGSTIGAMGTTFATHMEHMSTDLKAATDGIQAAIQTLSSGVTDTITQLQKASDEAGARQEMSRVAFATSSNELTKNLILMQDFMGQIKTQVDAGLKAVSTANNRMLSLDKHFEDRTKRADEMLTAMSGAAAAMTQVSGNLGAADAALASFAPVADEVRALTDLVRSQQALLATGGEQQQSQLADNARVLTAISLLTTAMTDLLRARTDDSTAAATPEPQAAP